MAGKVRRRRVASGRFCKVAPEEVVVVVVLELELEAEAIEGCCCSASALGFALDCELGVALLL